jgi:hypothetical protein
MSGWTLTNMCFAKGKLAGDKEGLLLLCKKINSVDSRDMKEQIKKNNRMLNGEP